MLSWSVIQFVFFLTFPWLLGKVLALFRSKEGPATPKRPLTRAESLVYYFVLIIAAYQLFLSYYAYSTSSNIFRTLDISTTVPNYQLRNRFREYAVNRAAQDPTFNLNPNFKLTDYKTRFILASDPSSFNRMSGLVELLYSTENRQIYNEFGEFAFWNCVWCQDTYDYFLFILPELLGSYAFVAAILGVATLFKRKEHWRTYGTIFLLGLGVLETMIFLSGEHDRNEFLSYKIEHLYETMEIVRRGMFAVFLVAVYIIDQTEDTTPRVLLERILEKEETMFNQTQALKLQRTAVLRDSHLRKIFTDYYKNEELTMEAIQKDPEYKEAYNKALMKYDLERLLKDSESMVDRIVADATMSPTSQSDKKNA
ncbi:hypothetical protein K493DRAFT_311008 [Basidiobolus meristosporus CBS 931.73]|uniref:Uncharacterized protein n=1 Tax=Basidiobolus meristosporus CBS 931.73 TaxID=1314790 RepID=A0A1Y1Z6A4_9FUNG|nr:hypothetical protein K493DRAFT_311008 [Basidiobolus meristosporus CBS 931.73]|eukprot:ORY05335.1 hypothetical protein K493DRAFT_311008 [Basidiobolus meristosporus CBS 931.73]